MGNINIAKVIITKEIENINNGLHSQLHNLETYINHTHTASMYADKVNTAIIQRELLENLLRAIDRSLLDEN